MAATDRLTDLAKGAFATWTDTLSAFRPALPSSEDARGLLDTGFSAAEKVLAVQRDFAKGVLDAGVQVVEKVQTKK
ncbi:hypothetical protein [Pseudonocardia sp. WMMC193]|uniref:hypothetical protein n=1 Tax=Pseudonocardia sp. WMMC193 TaxID=2911965 RepID=UPI001F1DF0B1|nr:hypothetical protein [Pseudonocardia sp. WMMC193]MCF7548716.1 hypothetical protein [Pseudonocardia sp. WMMC193]